MAKNSNNKLAFGIIILIVGLFYFLDKTGLLSQVPQIGKFLNLGTFLLVAGLIFLFSRADKMIGITFTAIGVFMNFNSYFSWLKGYSTYLIPIGLIAIGAYMIFSSKR